MRVYDLKPQDSFTCRVCNAIFCSPNGVFDTFPLENGKKYEKTKLCSEACKFQYIHKFINAYSDFWLEELRKVLSIRKKPFYKSISGCSKQKRTFYIRFKVVWECSKKVYFIQSQREIPLSHFSFSQIMRKRMNTFSFSHTHPLSIKRGVRKWVEKNNENRGLEEWL